MATRSRRRVIGGIMAAGLMALGVAGPADAARPNIVGGENASAGEYPFAVSLSIQRSDGSFSCGGSLVDPMYVLTAAHCVVGGDGTKTFKGATARIGATNLNDATQGQARSVADADAVVHPRYLKDSGTLDNDVAVLRLNQPSTMQPIDLASPEGPSDAALWPAGASATVIGWGWTTGTGSPTNMLQKGTVSVMSDADTAAKSPDPINAALHIGTTSSPTDSCKGDSGGPLFVQSARGPQQIGLVSFGPLPCATGEPGVYTEVAGRHLYRWVKSQIDETPVVGDIDGDGDADIVTATHQPQKRIYVARSLAKQGANRFASSELWHTNFVNDGNQVLLGDVNADGRADIWSVGDSDVYIGPSNGSNFSSTTIFAAGRVKRGETVRVGDVNGDHRADLVIFANDSSGDVFVALSTGNGLGARTKAHDYFAPAGETPEVMDTNGDGRADIVTFTQGMNGNRVYVAHSTGSAFGASFVAHDYFALSGEQPAVGYFNNGAIGDILTFTRDAGRDVYVGIRDVNSQFKATGSGVWHADFGNYPNTLRVGDVNGDGRDDLVNFTQGNDARALVALNNGSGFGAASQWHGFFAP